MREPSKRRPKWATEPVGGPERTPGYYQSEEEGSDTGLNEESAEGFAALYQIHWSSHEGRSLTPLWNF